jgi:hypothetical protein
VEPRLKKKDMEAKRVYWKQGQEGMMGMNMVRLICKYDNIIRKPIIVQN